VAIPWLGWNAIRTGGDVLGVRLYARYMAEVWHPQMLSQMPGGFRLFVRMIVNSSIGVFGNMSLPLPWPLRTAIAASVLVGAPLAARQLFRDPAQRRAVWFLAGAILVSLSAELLKSLRFDFSPQGRYVLIPVLLVAAAAAAGLARRWPRWALVFPGVLALSTLTMEWQLATKGR